MKTHRIPRERKTAMPNRLRELRLAHGLSQEDLSARTGMTQATISRIERGGSPPRPRSVRTLAGFFGVPGPYLMGLDVPKAEEAEPRAREAAKEAAV
jgi:transcriptional regulator with XRE-family HTH domain